jgi:cell division protein FtsB
MAATHIQHVRHVQARPGARWRRVLLVSAGCLVCALSVNALVGTHGMLALTQARADAGALSQTLGRMRVENARMRDDITRLQTDATAIEAIARRELGLIKAGEILFIVRTTTAAGSR